VCSSDLRTTSFSQTFEGKEVSIRNPFFYLSKSEFLSIPGLNKKIYEDCKNSEDSWLIKQLEEHKDELCKPAIELFEITKEITKRTIENRVHEINVRIKKDGNLVNTQLDSRWDAGWYQISHGILNNPNFQLDKSVLELYEQYKIKMKELEEYLKERTKELKLTDEVIIFDEKDRLIKMDVRWQTGEFFTPFEVVQIAYDKFCNYYNIDVLDLKEYNFWDPCAGRGNLLYGYPGPTYEKCVLSTLNQEDVDGMKKDDYYPGSIKFKYNFLDQTDEELPQELLKELENSENKWLSVFNPPWGMNKGLGLQKNTVEKNTSNRIRTEMKNSGINGRYYNELMFQSIFRFIEISKKFKLKMKFSIICGWRLLFSKDCLFRNYINDSGFKLRSGFIFRGNEAFKTSTVETAFCLIFDNEDKSQEDEIDLDIMVLDKKTKNYRIVGNKKYQWKQTQFVTDIKSPKKTNNGYIFKRDSLTIKNETKVPPNIICYADTTMTFNIYLGSLNGISGGGSGWYIVDERSLRNLMFRGFCYRYILSKWYHGGGITTRLFNENIIDKKLFNKITTNHLVWNVFHSAFGKTTSIKQIFNNIEISIRNSFFPIDKEEFKKFSGISKELYSDADLSENSWFVNYLIEHADELNDISKEILAIVKEIIKQTIHFRITKLFGTIKGGNSLDMQLDTRWDAGWYQIIYGILENTNITLPEEVKKLYEQYKIKMKELENSLRKTAKELKLTDEVIIFDEKESSNPVEDKHYVF
jgi:hypothetical protein